METNLENLSNIYKGDDHGFSVINVPKQKKVIHPPLRFKIGEMVEVYGMWGGGFTQDSKEKVTKIEKRYDEVTGQPYPIYKTESGQQFDGRNGMPLTPPLAYAIRKKGGNANEHY